MKKRYPALLFTFSFSLFIFLSLTPYSLSAQTNVIDSLQAVVATQKADTNKVKTYVKLSEKLYKAAQFDKAVENGVNALELSTKLSYLPGEADAFRCLGNAYYGQLKYPDALTNFTLGYKTAALLKDTFMMGYFAGRKGSVYFRMANHPMALQENFLSLRLRESIKDSIGMASTYINLGNVNSEQGNYTEALKYEYMALDISKRLKHDMNVSSCYNNIGGIEVLMKDYNNALDNFHKALTMAYNMNDQEGIAIAFSNIGEIYHDLKRNDSALVYFTKALTLKRKIKYKRGLESAYIDMALVYNSLKYYLYGRIYADSALKLTLKTGSENYISNAYAELAQADSSLGNFKLAMEEYIHSVAWRDSMVNDENTKKSVQAEMNYEFDKKQALEKLEQDKKDVIQQEEQRKQQTKLYFMGGVLGLVLVFTIFILLSLRANRKKTIIISKQKEEVEKQKAVVEEQNVFIEHQRAIVEEKNKDITDSIKYASRIQKALLTSDDYISQHLPEYFILFKPRDIVSGDFYWAFNGYGVFYIACCDCTGHGVPGAFMSLLNISMLNEAVIERKITRPDRILNDVRDNIIKALNPEKSDKESKDGMDCALCAIDLKNYTMQAACANNPVWIVKASPTPPKEGLMKEDSLSNLSKGEAKTYAYETADPILYGKLKEFVKENRSKPTEAEIAFWEIVKGRRLNGFKFRRQHIISQYIADFVCLPYKLIIEIDGLIHQLPGNIESDRVRTEHLAKLGFKVLRLKNEEVINDPDGACTKVLAFLNMYKGDVIPDNLPNEGEGWSSPTEAPPLEGLGEAFIELPVDKMPVGIQHGEQKPFTLQNAKLSKGDTIYLFTDGYADQFGGPKGKKFKYKALQEKILEISHKPMAEQKQILDKTIEDWRGGLEQVDDILIIGIRV